MSTPQENDSLQQDAQMPPDMAQPNTTPGASQDATQQQIDQLRRASDQDQVAQQNLDAVSGAPAGQLPINGNDDQDADNLRDTDIADLDDADAGDDMTPADAAGQG